MKSILRRHVEKRDMYASTIHPYRSFRVDYTVDLWDSSFLPFCISHAVPGVQTWETVVIMSTDFGIRPGSESYYRSNLY